MMRRLAGAGLTGWTAIMSLGWVLADRRAGRCADTYNCTVHELGTRDAFLVVGLLVPFLVITALALLGSRRAVQANWKPARTRTGLPARLDPLPTDLPSRIRFSQLRPFLRYRVATLVVAAFALGWTGAYVFFSGMPVADASERSVETSGEAAIDAAAAASDAATDAASAPRLIPAHGNPFDEPSPNHSASTPDNDQSEPYPGGARPNDEEEPSAN